MELVGECNRCGLCCRVERDGRGFRCVHLGLATEMGRPGASWCRVYASRTDGMVIHLVAEDGGAGMEARCGKGSLGEMLAILPHLSRGCSLTLKGD